MMNFARVRAQNGFTLLEVLLTIGLLAMLLTGAYQLFDSWLQRAINRQAAADILRLEQATKDYVYTNYDALKGDSLGNFTEVPLADLTAGKFLPSGYTGLNAFRQVMRVFKRSRLMPRSSGAGTEAVIDVVAISDNPAGNTIYIPNERLLDAAQAGGPQMGVYSQIVAHGKTYAGRITSPYSGWYIAPADLAAAGYTTTPSTSGGYIAAFDIVDGEDLDVNDNYLYRVSVNGRPELNRMQADLYMNSQPIEDAGSLVADKVTVTGNAAFIGKAQGLSSGSTSQAMTVDQALQINGNGQSRLNMTGTGCAFTAGTDANGNRTIPTGCDPSSISGGELQVISANGNATMTVTNNMAADGSVITDNAFVNTKTTAKGVSTFSDVDSSGVAATSTVIAPTTNITGGGTAITATSLQTSGLSTNGTNAGGNGIEATGSLVAAGVYPLGTGATITNGFTSTDVELGNAAKFTGNIIANGANASNTLHIGKVDTSAGALHDYNGSPYPSPNDYRTVQCILYGGITYCEPTGDSYWTWGTNQYKQTCTGLANGYKCNYYLWPAATLVGSCTHTRTPGVADYTESCS